MRLVDALEILKRPAAGDAPELKLFLACGFMPLHLQSFLAAGAANSESGTPCRDSLRPLRGFEREYRAARSIGYRCSGSGDRVGRSRSAPWDSPARRLGPRGCRYRGIRATGGCASATGFNKGFSLAGRRRDAHSPFASDVLLPPCPCRRLRVGIAPHSGIARSVALRAARHSGLKCAAPG